MASSILMLIPMLYKELYEAFDHIRVQDELSDGDVRVVVLCFLRSRAGRLLVGLGLTRSVLQKLMVMGVSERDPHELGFALGAVVFLGLFVVVMRF